jgi:hypothetical protein
MKELQDICYKLLWDGEPDKMKTNVIIYHYEEGGGVKLPHIVSFYKAPIGLGFTNFLIP